MDRLTTDYPGTNLQHALNLFYAKDGEAWVRDGNYHDTTLNIYIRAIIEKFAPAPSLEDVDDTTLAEIMTDWLCEGPDSIEGLIATLYTAGWAFAELRARLKAYEETGRTPDGKAFE